MALVVTSDASLEARKNLSSLLVMFKPYVISMMSAAMALAKDVAVESWCKVITGKAHNWI